MPTREQVSAGGVAFRRVDADAEVALVRVGSKDRWQLPKGIIERGESAEETAVREVREEAGLATELVAPIETIEYWYVGHRGTERVRFHKWVHFFLLAYRSGRVTDHDHEVHEARWVPLAQAKRMLAFENERAVVDKAGAMIERMHR